MPVLPRPEESPRNVRSLTDSQLTSVSCGSFCVDIGQMVVREGILPWPPRPPMIDKYIYPGPGTAAHKFREHISYSQTYERQPPWKNNWTH